MKKLIMLAFAATLFFAAEVAAQNQYNHQRRSLFEQLGVSSGSIVFLGDSITDGGEWSELTGTSNALNRGISGDRAEWLMQRMPAIVDGRPKKIFLLIGTNDLSEGRTVDQVVKDIASCVEYVKIKSPKTKLYIESIFPVNGENFDKFKKHYPNTEKIVQVNERLKQLCQKHGLEYIDVYSALVDSSQRLSIEYTNDGLHLMASGYKVWVEVLKPYIKK